ncbi:hypothetical protein Cgig2_009398 [Carnegiea gigantea]|uniref:Uncharacterized protein n=1 Tax=Carnegiea gigantea TaxID=171969 RepID=A0A9Q1JSH1_9CARY|nr:hypothetical protein Cgig2_009398 [Carnegiea gigantea]
MHGPHYLILGVPPLADVVDHILSQLDNCAEGLTKWNNETFGLLSTNIHKLEWQLCCTTDVINRRRILGEIQEWQKKEEILWWQRALSDYLKYDDVNTRWFHSRATMRKAKKQNSRPVSDLIDFANGCWNEPLINSIFLPCDTELILKIPLCETWPLDKLIWHYNSSAISCTGTPQHLRAMLISDGPSGTPASHCVSSHLVGELAPASFQRPLLSQGRS